MKLKKTSKKTSKKNIKKKKVRTNKKNIYIKKGGNPKKIIGIMVSYNYYDTLKFTLPVNYIHFEKLYVITQPDDIDTVKLCEKYNNVEVIYYNFKSLY